MTDSAKRHFLFVSTDGLHVDPAWRILREGHEVRYCIENPAEADIGDGFVPKVDDWREHVDWADIIVFDDVLGQGEKAHALRQQGKAVIGGTPYTDQLEDDRSFGQEELKKAGINILPYREFTDFDEAIAHVRANPRRYVIKPSGEAQNIKRLLFVGMEEDGSDVARVLEAYKRVWSDTIKVFQLQHKVTGVEVAVGGFFNGREFMDPININFEHKKLLPGNVGPATGEMGTSMFWSGPNRLYRETLAKLAPKLAGEGFVGYMDLNCIVNSHGIYPLEFTSRFGYPTIQIQSDGLAMPLADFFHQMATGGPAKFKVKRGFQVGVRLVVPPYPFKDKETFESYSKGAAIVFKRPMTEGVHIHDVKRVNDEWLVTGGAGLALVVSGSGSTMREAQKQAYARIQNILIPNMYFRDDIGDRWIDDSDRLHTWGYLREN
ncbi:phosphoribosylglycinamide synthetase C domain-containing protein [Hyphobacterium sp. HN65]|uniref:Glycinamide ribonucleotide synthetase n=1 Tax=Hyphobacterium lacteum TaxID=3116575 RepID=A0ABU7LSH7_9PROT|nr:phosphoribosylglycinamide synthetase C domain-containing protein [Hyphobacterium sp. HN65]MEE2526870.1 phosphoribosylglycinamide synthetase C domain-containing protein [Hyphobacterium sp. HN65]